MGDITVSSHVQGRRTPLLNLTIGDALAAAAERWPDNLALVDCPQKVRLDYRTLQSRVTDVAAGLAALGLAQGDRIGVWSLNRWEWTLVQFAAARIGAILVTINPAYRTAELTHALSDSGCKILVISPTFKASDFLAMVKAVVDGFGTSPISSTSFPNLRHVVTMGSLEAEGTISFSTVESDGRSRVRAGQEIEAEGLHPDQPINIQYTSGTTGRPKGVTLSHRNILNNGYFVGQGLNLTSDDRICIPVPLYHCFGLVMGNLAAITHGCAMVYPGEGFDPLATLQAVEEERCTALYGVPTMFIAELDQPRFEEFDLSSLRTGIMAGAPCPIEIMRRVASHMHMHEVTICYGMTETSPVSLQSDVDDPLDKRACTVGRVGPNLEVKIVDAAGAVVERGVSGELCTRGYSVMLGYWNRPDQTAAVIDADGWMHSGDLATLDADGYCNIVGRLKDMVIRGGENLYPREIEEFLYRHPAVRDVQVFGVPDARYGEELCAWIIVREGADVEPDEIRKYCEGQIAHQKIPRHVRFVAEFPMTVTGKPQKYLMREAMIEELGETIVATA